MLSLPELQLLVNERLQGWDKNDIRRYNWRKIYYQMSLHIDGVRPTFNADGYLSKPVGWVKEDWIEYDILFNFFILNQYPNEDGKLRNWRLSQYRPFTRAPFIQCIQVVSGSIFQDSGYTIDIKDREDSDYIWGNSFDDKSLPQFVSDNFASIAEDPNGLFVVIPKVSDKIEPEIWFVFSKHLIHVTKDEIVFIRDGVKWVVNKVGYFRYHQIEGKGEWVNMDEAGGYYAHMLDRVPAYVAGGVWNNQGYYSSWFEAALPIADEYASSYSAEQLVYRDASYPTIIEAAPDCPECQHTGTMSWCFACNCQNAECAAPLEHQLKWGLHNCTTCGGSKHIARNPGQRMQAPADQMANDLVKYINPDTAINKLHTDRNKEIFNEIFRSLYLNYIDQAQSGVAKDKDMEARYQFTVRVSNDLFDRLITGLITTILELRNVRSINGSNRPDAGDFVIVKPTQFQVKTSYDLAEDYKLATESQLPDYIRQEISIDYIDKQFGGNDYLKKKTDVINQLDLFAVTNPADIQIALLNGAAQARDYQLHLRLPTIIDRIKREKGTEWVLDATFDMMEAEVKRIFDVLQPPKADLGLSVSERVIV